MAFCQGGVSRPVTLCFTGWFFAVADLSVNVIINLCIFAV